MDMVTCNRTVGKKKARLDVFRLQNRVFLEYRLCGVACRKHSQNVFHRDAHVANDGLTTKDIRAHGNTLE